MFRIMQAQNDRKIKEGKHARWELAKEKENQKAREMQAELNDLRKRIKEQGIKARKVKQSTSP